MKVTSFIATSIKTCYQGRGGGARLVDGWGSADRYSESYPLLNTETCRHTYFIMNIGGKLPTLTIFLPVSQNSLIFKENLPKKDPF